MNKKWLRIINYMAIPTIVLVIALSLLFARGWLGPGISLGLLIFWFVLYIDLKNAVQGFMDNRRKLNIIPPDAEREHNIKYINYSVIIVGVIVGVFLLLFAGTMLAREQFIFAVIFTAEIMILANVLNVFLRAIYLINKNPLISLSSIIKVMAIAFVVLAFSWVFLSKGQLIYIAIFMAIAILLWAIYYYSRHAMDALKRISGKPADLERERMIKIFNYGALIAIIAFILFIPGLVGLIIVVMIVVNLWGFISDISINTDKGPGR